MQTQLHSLLVNAFEQTKHMPRTRRGARKYQVRKLIRELYRQGATNRLPLGVDRAPEPRRPISYLPWRLVPITFVAPSSPIGAPISSAYALITHGFPAIVGRKRWAKTGCESQRFWGSSSPAHNSSRDDNPGRDNELCFNIIFSISACLKYIQSSIRYE